MLMEHDIFFIDCWKFDKGRKVSWLANYKTS